MHVITKRRITEFVEKHPDAAAGLDYWYRATNRAQWSSLADVRQTFRSADLVGRLTVFNISKHRFRLITYIDYINKIVYIRSILTHAEYDKEEWKRDPWY